jgi:hypothetical protein
MNTNYGTYDRKKLIPEKRFSHLAGYVFWWIQITTGKKLRLEKKESQNNLPENNVVLVPAKIWQELAPYYFLADCFEKKNNPKQSTGK